MTMSMIMIESRKVQFRIDHKILFYIYYIILYYIILYYIVLYCIILYYIILLLIIILIFNELLQQKITIHIQEALDI